MGSISARILRTNYEHSSPNMIEVIKEKDSHLKFNKINFEPFIIVSCHANE